ncbi:MAG: hypothetical protein PHI12_14390, partial [Dehalococcoidales bacterium]|nr:hypothetical protein [Dehalococcoidales bacterium]
MLKIQDTGELVYGGVVTLCDWLDDNRVKKGTLAANKIWKKYATWAFLGIGVAATLMSIFGAKMRKV